MGEHEHDHDHAAGDPTKRHRHDVGQVDHGPETTAFVTHAIQLVLGAAILASVGLAGYAVILMAR